MAPPLEKFVKQLEESGILAGDTLKDFLPPKREPKDATELARELVRQKKLTKFQVEEVSKGKGKSLILGKYVLMEKIGAGGMGQVFKAEHRRMHRIVALKLLHSAMSMDKDAIARFEREVTAAAKLSHPNIVAAYDADFANDVHFLVMEFVEGSDLAALVKKNGPFPMQEAVNYIMQAAKGLEAAHKKGVVHRDVKPANLLLDTEGTIKILDMGLARIQGDVAGLAGLTETGIVMGTVDYMAPEQAVSTKTADCRSDIYSLGCTFHYLLTARATFEGDTLMSRMLAHREQPIPSLKTTCHGVSDELDGVFHKMVAKTPEDRYQSMTEVIGDLEKLVLVAATAIYNSGNSVPAVQPSVVSQLDRTVIAQVSETIEPTIKRPNRLTKTNKVILYGVITAGIAAILFLSAIVVTLDTIKDRKLILKRQDPLNDSVERNRLAFELPGFDEWAKAVQAMPPETQLEAVSEKLMELNPGFDGTLTGGFVGVGQPLIENGAVTSLGCQTISILDISPVRALRKLKNLDCSGPPFNPNGAIRALTPLMDMELVSLKCSGNPRLTDLSVVKSLHQLRALDCSYSHFSDLSLLQGMNLCDLSVCSTEVFDLSPLNGMPLNKLQCWGTKVKDLSPLRGMTLKQADFASTLVSDLSPLEGMPLTVLNMVSTQVSDLSPLNGMPLSKLYCGDTKIDNLSPLKGMKLTAFECFGTEVSDLSPLEGMPLELLNCSNTRVEDLSPLRGMKLKELRAGSTRIKSLSPVGGMPLGMLEIDRTEISDLTPLRGMKLNQLFFLNTNVIDLEPLDGMNLSEIAFCPERIQNGMEVVRNMTSLKKISPQDREFFAPTEFWKKFDAGEFGNPAKPVTD